MHILHKLGNLGRVHGIIGEFYDKSHVKFPPCENLFTEYVGYCKNMAVSVIG